MHRTFQSLRTPPHPHHSLFRLPVIDIHGYLGVFGSVEAVASAEAAAAAAAARPGWADAAAAREDAEAAAEAGSKEAICCW